jgi:hypothetical protein
MMRSTRGVTDARARAESAAAAARRVAVPENEAEPAGPGARARRFEQWRQDRGARSALAEPVGYEVDAFEARIAKAAEARPDAQFDIERRVHTLRNRFAPFGGSLPDGAPSAFFSDTAKFYSETTSLCCLWCTEPCNCVPVPLPVRYWCRGSNASDFCFWVRGQYCSFGCMLAAFREESMRSSRNPGLQLARMMLRRVYGVPMSAEVRAAPDPRCLRKFGGIYSIEQFRATAAAGVRTAVVSLPFLPFSAGITEIESIEITISEVGGAELARRRVRGGANAAGLANPISNPLPVNTQRGKFATAPTIREQIEASDRRLRLQMAAIPAERKKKTLLDFMVKKDGEGK